MCSIDPETGKSYPKCKKLDCDKPAAPGQAYCERAHSPYGHLGIQGSVWNNGRPQVANRPNEVLGARLIEILGISQSHFSILFATGKIPGRREERLTYFDPDKVRAALFEMGWTKGDRPGSVRGPRVTRRRARQEARA